MIRTGLLTFDYQPAFGGQGIFSQGLVSSFRDLVQDIELVVFSPSMSTGPEEISLYPFCRGSAHGHIAFSILVSRTIQRLVKEHSLNCLLINGGRGGVHISALRMIRKMPVPSIVVSNGTYSQAPIPFWKYPFRQWEIKSYAQADRTVAISHWVGEELTNYYGVPKDRVRIIHYGVDLNRFKPAESRAKETTLLFIGRVEERKGALLLLRAFAEVRTDFPELRLVIAGSGSQLPLLQELAVRLHCAERVSFPGWISQEEAAQLYRDSAIVVVPSYSEGFGLVALEALACGTPVVASNTQGLRDIVRHGETGLSFEPGDQAGLARALRELLCSPELAQRLSRNGIRHAEQFTWQACTDAYANLIRECVSEAT